MKITIALLLIGCFSLQSLHSGDTPVFEIEAGDTENIVLEATPNEPWIFSITLTEQKISDYKRFTEKNLGKQISLVVTKIEIYRPDIRAIVESNPITFRMFDQKKFLSILSALPPDPE